MKNRRPDGTKIPMCTLCGRVFSSWNDLSNHQAMKGADGKCRPV